VFQGKQTSNSTGSRQKAEWKNQGKQEFPPKLKEDFCLFLKIYD
jgi:hypothetical protein